jgi:hypothetical protein
VFGADNASGGRECLAGISRRSREKMRLVCGGRTVASGEGFAALPHRNAASAQILLDGDFGTI